MDAVRVVDQAQIDAGNFTRTYADCIVLTQDGKLLLQQRPADWYSSANCLTAFGGHVEAGESPLSALIRELNEELGAQVSVEDVVCLGAISEAFTGHTELVHAYFWHDRAGTITGCYECEAVYYDRVASALSHPKIMDYVRWMLGECMDKGLVV